ncbi:Alpha-1,2-mannosyltransferase ALG9 [Orchesella cincta]|uniref:Mannosyltransferase n=1 Tax=Orchesella cincta TaxID=48709 RepID=A0A1D2MV64_ORCCI|nr:Alpha-1,2-mannosyltransferase ALG9 [Orchesella cincta]
MGGKTRARQQARMRATASSKSSGNKQSKEYVVMSRNKEEMDALDDLSSTGSVGRRGRSKAAADSSAQNKPVEYLPNDPYWSPSPYSAFKLLISARFAAALWSTISDCDETFNYWEPTHYLLYGKGFQTWEYSPVYALRSYTYILFHAVPAKIYDYLFSPTPLLIFFFIRCFLSFICAGAEAVLYRAVRRRLGGNIARMALITSLFSAGMFICCCAYLPSAFSAYMTAFAIAAWLEGLDELAIFAVALSALLSWPFAALTGVFIAVDIVLIRKEILLFIKWSVLSLLVILIPTVVLDSNMYGKLVIAPLNIVMYNVFSTKGPDLYGTESWTFYFINGSLNFNILFIMAILSPVLILMTLKIQDRIREQLIIIATVFTWLVVFLLQPHKEERFLFPIYPLIPIAGAIGVDCVQKLCDIVCAKVFLWWIQGVKDFSKVRVWDYRKIATTIGVAAIMLTSAIGCSRILALHYGYRAPFDIFFQLHRDPAAQHAVQAGRNYTVCYGKEWHRFPASFFIPSLMWDVRFVQSEFKGQLPDRYSPYDSNGTKKIPEHMNDFNLEEPTRYVNITQCDYLVDLSDPERVTPLEPNYAAKTSEWKVLSEYPFLNPAKSHVFFRAFYIPIISAKYTTYDSYVLLDRKRKSARSRKSGKEFHDDDL